MSTPTCVSEGITPLVEGGDSCPLDWREWLATREGQESLDRIVEESFCLEPRHVEHLRQNPVSR